MGIERIYIIAGGAAALIAVVLTVALVARKRRNAKNENTSDKRGNAKSSYISGKRGRAKRKASTDEAGMKLGRFLVANLQGLGKRDNQQDAFGISAMKGEAFAMILADGMGGLSDGARIANETVGGLLELFAASETPPAMEAWRSEALVLSERTFEAYQGAGGATLVLAQIEGDKLNFLSIGDSDLFLWREGLLYSLSRRHEYVNDLLIESLESGTDVNKAFSDPQASALSAYIGLAKPEADYTKRPFALRPGDVLMLCSDGVSDTLSLALIRDAMSRGAAGAAKQIETDIASANAPHQDNFTAIIAEYIG